MNDRVRKLEASGVFAEEMLVAAIQSELEELLAETGCSRADLAKRMGVTKARVSQIFSDDQNFTVRLVARAFHALDQKVRIVRDYAEGIETKSDRSASSKAAEHFVDYVVQRHGPRREHGVFDDWLASKIYGIAFASRSDAVNVGEALASFVRAQVPEPSTRHSHQGKSDLSRAAIDAWAEERSNVVPIRKAYACG